MPAERRCPSAMGWFLPNVAVPFYVREKVLKSASRGKRKENHDG